MTKKEEFEHECDERVKSYKSNSDFVKSRDVFMYESTPTKYSYNFSWLGRPIIQYPQDIVAIQEIIWAVKPNLIIETGIARGGSLIFSASMLTLLEAAGHIKSGTVLGIDIDIREHNRVEIEKHPFYNKIKMLQGSSIDEKIVQQVKNVAEQYDRILVILDSNHTHKHVLKELNAYSPLVSVGSYCIVLDTIVEDLPNDLFNNRPWGKGNNPKTAVKEFLNHTNDFIIDEQIFDKIMISVAPDGYLKRVN